MSTILATVELRSITQMDVKFIYGIFLRYIHRAPFSCFSSALLTFLILLFSLSISRRATKLDNTIMLNESIEFFFNILPGSVATQYVYIRLARLMFR